MTASFIVSDVFDGLATLEAGSVDLVVTSPPFLALRSYLPADHPDKGKEIGSESTPAKFIDVLLRVSAELRRVLAPHGSIAVELGDTYAGSGGAGGDYGEDGLRDGQPKFRQVGSREHRPEREGTGADGGSRVVPFNAGPGWPLAKSKTLIPELFRVGLAYGINPLTGVESPAGRWRVRNVVTWCRPNPPVGALGDKWRPATSDLVVACVSEKRYWDDLATRRPHRPRGGDVTTPKKGSTVEDHLGGGQKRADARAFKGRPGFDLIVENPAGAPLLDYWELTPGGYKGAHYAVFPPELVEPLVKAMGPQRVCRTCGEPSRPVIAHERTFDKISDGAGVSAANADLHPGRGPMGTVYEVRREAAGWTDCGHDNYRPGLVLDPFAGSGTTLHVADALGRDSVGFDIDERNAVQFRQRLDERRFNQLRQIELL